MSGLTSCTRGHKHNQTTAEILWETLKGFLRTTIISTTFYCTNLRQQVCDVVLTAVQQHHLRNNNALIYSKAAFQLIDLDLAAHLDPECLVNYYQRIFQL